MVDTHAFPGDSGSYEFVYFGQDMSKAFANISYCGGKGKAQVTGRIQESAARLRKVKVHPVLLQSNATLDHPEEEQN